MTSLKPKQHSAPTVEEIQSDVLTEVKKDFIWSLMSFFDKILLSSLPSMGYQSLIL